MIKCFKDIKLEKYHSPNRYKDTINAYTCCARSAMLTKYCLYATLRGDSMLICVAI